MRGRMNSTSAGAMLGTVLGALLGASCKEPGAPTPITITGVSPARDWLRGKAGVTITGTNFLDVTSVTIGGSELVDRTVVSSTEITGTAPVSTSAGAKDVVVTSSSHGSGTCSGCFTYLSALTFAAVSAGGDSCGITTDGRAYCWGPNGWGGLGNGTITPYAGSTVPVAVAGGVSLQSRSALRHVCAVATSGAAWWGGRNEKGQIGDGTIENQGHPTAVQGGLRFAQVSAGWDLTCGVTVGGAAYCWGWNQFGQLGDGTEIDRTSPVAVVGGLGFTEVSAGQDHTCGVTAGAAGDSWITEPLRRHGGGAMAYSTTPIAVAGGLAFTMVSAGLGHACGITTEGAAYCWGRNDEGELGDGTTTSSSIPVKVAGSRQHRHPGHRRRVLARSVGATLAQA